MSKTQPSTHIDLSIPGYEIKRELGRGGMAVVYLAIQESFGREVALKVLPLINASDTSFTERFIREAKIVSRLVHPNIVTVYDVGIHQGHHYLSMEFIPGMDLRKAQARLSRIELVQAIKYVASALDFAGKKGYVHRDIKPENIMLHEEDNRVILMDFGIARGSDTTMSMTATGSAIGTPYYMSPEQTKGQNVDYRSDIYSLGVVLYQMLTGRVPYDANSAVAVGIKHITAPIPVLPQNLQVFQAIINTALAKSREHRYQSAGEMITALDAIPDSILQMQQDEAEKFRAANLDYDASTIATSNEAIQDLLPTGQTEVIKTPLPKSNYTNTQTSIKRSTFTGHKPAKNNARRTTLFYFLLALLFGAGIYKKDMLYDFIQSDPSSIKAEVKKSNSRPAETISTPLTANTSPTTKKSDLDNITVQQSDTQASEALKIADEIFVLTQNLDENPENALQIARHYKQTLRHKPNDPEARQGIKHLREWYTTQITNALENNDLDVARQRVNMLKQSFPRMSLSPRYVALNKRIKREQAYVTHLQQAEKYIAFKQLSSPADANALSELIAANNIHPDQEEVIKLRDEVADFYFTEATGLLKQGRQKKAQRSIAIGLKASPNHKDLLSLSPTSEIKKPSSKTIYTLLTNANDYYNNKQFFSPAGKNAYDTYRLVLKHDPVNEDARKGLNKIKQYWLKIFNNELKQGNLDKATSTLTKIQERYAREPDIKNAQTKLARALSTLLPEISMVLISTKKLYSLRTAPSVIEAHKPINAGFHYSNFAKTNSAKIGKITDPLNIILIRLSDNKKYITQGINVRGNQGDKFIVLDVDSAWLGVGQYRMEFRLGSKLLTHKTFSLR